jgi:RND family efflux transporter MFP subunit
MKQTPIALAVIAPLAALLALGGCKGGEAVLPAAAPSGADAVGVKVVKPRADAGTVMRATGELRARNEAVLSAEASGRILRFRVDVGSRVHRGDLLMELDASGPRIAVQQAQAARAAAEAARRSVAADLRRTEELTRGGAASAATLEKLQIGIEQADAAVQQATAAAAAAEDQLAKTAVRAPFDGVVTARLKSAGEYVAMTPPTPVLAVVDVATVEVRVPVPESLVDLLAPGDELEAAVSPSGKPFRAKVRSIGSAVDAGTRTVDVRADLVGATFRELRPGAIVEVRLGKAGGEAQGVFLPAEAVRDEGGKSYVWAVVSDEARRRPVDVQRLNPGTVRVLSGLGPDDRVVADGGAGLTDGVRVHVQE